MFILAIFFFLVPGVLYTALVSYRFLIRKIWEWALREQQCMLKESALILERALTEHPELKRFALKACSSGLTFYSSRQMMIFSTLPLYFMLQSPFFMLQSLLQPYFQGLNMSAGLVGRTGPFIEHDVFAAMSANLESIAQGGSWIPPSSMPLFISSSKASKS